MERLPADLQYLPPDKQRESDPDIRKIIVECLFQVGECQRFCELPVEFCHFPCFWNLTTGDALLYFDINFKISWISESNVNQQFRYSTKYKSAIGQHLSANFSKTKKSNFHEHTIFPNSWKLVPSKNKWNHRILSWQLLKPVLLQWNQQVYTRYGKYYAYKVIKQIQEAYTTI